MNRKAIKSDLARIDAMTDAEIDYSDIPAFGLRVFQEGHRGMASGKQQLTIRLDADVLVWLKGQGRGYQTRINHILRAAMDSQRPNRPPPAPATKGSAKSGKIR